MGGGGGNGFVDSSARPVLCLYNVFVCTMFVRATNCCDNEQFLSGARPVPVDKFAVVTSVVPKRAYCTMLLCLYSALLV